MHAIEHDAFKAQSHHARVRGPRGFARWLWRDHTSSALRLAVSLVSLGVLLHSYWFTRAYFIPAAFWDMFNWIDDFQRYEVGAYHFGDLFSQHNEHRIAAGRIFLFVDALAFHMTGRFVVVSNLLLLGILGGLLKRMSQLPGVAGTAAEMPGLFFVACATSVCQWENLISPFQISFALLTLFVGLAIFCLQRAARSDLPARHLDGCAAAAAAFYGLATFSLASGLLAVLPCGILLLLLRARPRITFIFLVPSFIFAGLFLYHFVPPGHGAISGLGAADKVLTLLPFAAAFLGCALAAYDDWAGLAGFAGLGAITLISLSYLRRWLLAGRRTDPDEAGNFAFATYVVACAGTVAIARFFEGPAGAVHSRYSIMSIVFFLCISNLMLAQAARSRFDWLRVAVRTPLAACAAVIGLALINFSPSFAQNADMWHSGLVTDARRVRENVAYEARFDLMYFRPISEIGNELRFLRARRLNIFAPRYDISSRDRRRLRALAQHRPPVCDGAIDQAYGLDGTRMVLRGWLADLRSRFTPDRVGVVDGDGNVITVFVADRLRDDVRVARQMKSQAYGFDTAIGGLTTSGRLRLVGMFAGRPDVDCIFDLRQIYRDVVVQAIPPGAQTAPVTAVASTTGAFGRDSTAGVGVMAGWPPGHTLSNDQAGDSRIGTASYTVAWPAADRQPGDGQPGDERALLVPFLTGDPTPNESLAVLFADGTGCQLRLPIPGQASAWHMIAIPGAVILRHGGTVRLGAEDRSIGARHWLTIGQPVAGAMVADAARLY